MCVSWNMKENWINWNGLKLRLQKPNDKVVYAGAENVPKFIASVVNKEIYLNLNKFPAQKKGF